MSDIEPPDPAEIIAETELIEASQTEQFGDRLRDEHVGTRLVRGGSIRFIGYAIGSLAVAGSAVLLLRYLGPAEFGDFSAVLALAMIVIGISDNGLNTVGNRELAVCKTAADRRKVLSEILGIRLVLTPLCVLGSVAFAALAGYDDELVLGTLIAGVGVILMTTSSSFSLPLAVDLKITALTSLDLLKQVVPAIVFVLLIASGSGLLPFFAATIPGAVVAIALTPRLAGREAIAWPNFNVRKWWPLALKALPVAVASTIAIIYLRVLTVALYGLTTNTETGLFSTSVRAIELILAVPWMVFSIALPVLSVSNSEDLARSRIVLQRMIDVAIVAAGGLSVVLCLSAPTVIHLIGGVEFEGAVPILQVHAFTLAAAFVGQACMFAAVASEKTRELVWINSFGLAVIILLGIPMIELWGGTGAAGATIVADYAIVVAYLIVLRRGPKGMKISLRSVWKPALAAAVAFAIGILSGLSPMLQATIAGVAYLALIVVTRAVPPEVWQALRFRGGSQKPLGL